MRKNFIPISFEIGTERDIIFGVIEKEIEKEKTKEDIEKAISYISDRYL